MSKRKISKQQKARIQQIHAKRRMRAQELEADKQYPDTELAGLGAEQEGLLITNYGIFADVEAASGNIYRCHIRQHLGTLVTGDQVVWCAQENQQSGVIVAVLPRNSLLYRADEKGEPKPIAANLEQMIIVIAPQPKPTLLLIDSYLVAAELTQINPIILLNKTDLLEENDTDLSTLSMDETLNEYASIGYQTLMTSSYLARGLEQLIKTLQGHTSVFVGQSGVGKSSLINNLLPKEKIAVSAISETTGFGSHTTTASRLYHLPSGGNIIDSPGIRDFGLWELKPEDVSKGFIEFQPFMGHCKFRNCQHVHEPNCAIKQAVEDETISKRRYLNYLQLTQSQ